MICAFGIAVTLVPICLKAWLFAEKRDPKFISVTRKKGELLVKMMSGVPSTGIIEKGESPVTK
jgi:hypothetical protein